MQTATSRRTRDGILVGTGAAITLVAVLVLQSFGIVSLGTRTVTEANSTVSLGPPYPATSLETFNVNLGSQSGIIGVDENLGRIYAGSASYDNLTVIDEYSHAVVASIQLPDIAQVIAADYGTHMVYVDAGGAVVEINGTTDQVVGELHAKMGTFAYDPRNQVVYGQVNDNLVGLDVRTGSVVANVSGIYANSVAVDPDTNMVAAAGCKNEGMVCNDTAFMVNGTSDSIVATVPLGGGDYPLVAANTDSDIFIVSDGALIALNETNGKVVFNVPQQGCASFNSMTFARNTDHLLVVSSMENYTFVYDGRTGALLDMYSLPAAPWDVAENPLTNELYVTMSSQLMSFHDSAAPGHVDIALVDSGGNCPIP